MIDCGRERGFIKEFFKKGENIMNGRHDHCNHHNHREKNIKIAILLNVSFAIIEIIGGLWTNSLAILSEALHDCGDSVSLIISLFAEKIAKKKPDSKRTFGYQRLSLFSAVLNAGVLMAGLGIVLYFAILRLLNPEPINADGMMWLALLGIVFNGVAFLRLKKGQSQNEKVLTWCMLNDALKWVVILVGAIILKFCNYPIIDPIMTIIFAFFIIAGVAGNLKETANIFLQGVPAHIDIENIKNNLLEIDGVLAVHDVHIWSLDGEIDILTGHIVVDNLSLRFPNEIKKKIKEKLTGEHIEHSTIELEGRGGCSGDGYHLEK